MADHWAMGGEGATDLARAVVKVCDSGKSKLKFLYPDEMPLFEKIRTIAREIYRAKDVSAEKAVKDQLAAFEAMGYGTAPICVAKTQYSFSTNPDAKGAPVDHIDQRARSPALRGRGVRGRHLRRDHDHAGPAAGCRRPTPSTWARTAGSSDCSDALGRRDGGFPRHRGVWGRP